MLGARSCDVGCGWGAKVGFSPQIGKVLDEAEGRRMDQHVQTTGSRYPASQWVYGAFAVPIVVALFWSMFASRFVPTAEGVTVAVAFSLFVAALAGLFGWKSSVFRRENERLSELVARTPAFATPQTRIPVLMIAAFMFTLPATEHGLLDWWTEASGIRRERLVHLSSYIVTSRYSCRGFDVREAPMPLGPAVCADLGRYPGPKPGTPVMLFGLSTPFGTIVDRYRVAPAS